MQTVAIEVVAGGYIEYDANLLVVGIQQTGSKGFMYWQEVGLVAAALKGAGQRARGVAGCVRERCLRVARY